MNTIVFKYICCTYIYNYEYNYNEFAERDHYLYVLRDAYRRSLDRQPSDVSDSELTYLRNQ